MDTEQQLTDAAQSSSILQVLDGFRGERFLCDVVLHLTDREVPAHKAVLAAFSPYFRAMFSCGLAESSSGAITMRHIDSQTLADIIQFAYSSTIKITDENIQSLLTTADMLQTPSIKSACCSYLSARLQPHNCLGIRALAATHSCHDLYNDAHGYTCRNFSLVIKEEEFLSLSREEILQFLGPENAPITRDDSLYLALVRWARHSPESRSPTLESLLKYLNMTDFSGTYIDKLETSALAQDRPQDACQPLHWKNVLMAIGGEAQGQLLYTVEWYVETQHSRCWTTAIHTTCGTTLSTSSARAGMATVNIGSYVYVIGGTGPHQALKTMERYNLTANCWEACSSLLSARHGAACSLIDGQIYLLGGRDEHSHYMNTVEMYDNQSDTWMEAAPMRQRRSFFGAASFGGYLYAVGGSGGNVEETSDRFLDTVERYDPYSRTWTTVRAMNHTRSYHTVATLNGYIYAVGGYNGKWLNCVERFDPQINQWTIVAPLHRPRSSAALVVMNNALYCAGGFNGKQYMNCMERYDPGTDKWTDCAPMWNRRYAMGLAAVTVPVKEEAKMTAQRVPERSYGCVHVDGAHR